MPGFRGRLCEVADLLDAESWLKRTVVALRSLRERSRHVRGVFAGVGFKQIGVGDAS